MDSFVTLPSWSTAQAGIAPIMGGFWSAFNPLIFWGVVLFITAGIGLMIFKLVLIAGNQIQNMMDTKENPYDINNMYGGILKKKDNWIKPGSIEDLSNKHYGYTGRQKEEMDRAKLKK